MFVFGRPTDTTHFVKNILLQVEIQAKIKIVYNINKYVCKYLAGNNTNIVTKSNTNYDKKQVETT